MAGGEAQGRVGVRLRAGGLSRLTWPDWAWADGAWADWARPDYRTDFAPALIITSLI